MVLNSSVVLTVANVSANACQYIACNPERLNSDQVLNLIFCLPLRHLCRFIDSLWLYLCFSPPYRHPLSDSSDEDSDDSHYD